MNLRKLIHNGPKPMFQSALPAQAQAVADVIGREQAFHLALNWKRTKPSERNRRGRVCVYVPAKLTPEHELVRIIGWTDAAKLVDVFRGEILHLPQCAGVLRDWRNQAIRRQARDGLSTSKAAFLFDMTDRQVRNVIASGNRRSVSPLQNAAN